MMTAEQLSLKMERVHALADILLSILDEDPKAQILTQIIMELSLLPEV